MFHGACVEARRQLRGALSSTVGVIRLGRGTLTCWAISLASESYCDMAIDISKSNSGPTVRITRSQKPPFLLLLLKTSQLTLGSCDAVDISDS